LRIGTDENHASWEPYEGFSIWINNQWFTIHTWKDIYGPEDSHIIWPPEFRRTTGHTIWTQEEGDIVPPRKSSRQWAIWALDHVASFTIKKEHR
jgi:hypothetical protein